MGSALESPEIQVQLVGAWVFLGLFFVNAVFNTILGEEFLFRGVLLPKMDGVFGKWDWVVNGLLNLYTNNLLKLTPEQYEGYPFRIP